MSRGTSQYPFESQRRVYSTFDQNFDFKIRREHQKNFLWAPHPWVDRRYEPILGYPIGLRKTVLQVSKG